MNTNTRPAGPQPYRGGFRATVINPLTGRRVAIVDKDPGVVTARINALKNVRADIRLGVVEPHEVARRTATLAHGPLMISEAWAAYHRALGDDGAWKKQAESTWKHRLEKTFGRLVASEANDEKLKAWEAEQRKATRPARGGGRKPISPRTIRNAFELLRAVLNAMVPHRLAALPWRDYSPPSYDRKALTREGCRDGYEVIKLIGIADEADQRCGFGYADLAARIGLGALVGWRTGEATAASWDDIRWIEREWEEDGRALINVRHATRRKWREKHPDWTRPIDPPKYGSTGDQELHPAAIKMLVRLRQRQLRWGVYDPHGPLFPCPKTGTWRLNPRIITPERIRELVRLAGFPNVEKWVHHSLRISKGTLEMLGNGGDVMAVAKMLRHSDPRQSMVYLRPAGRGAPSSRIAGVDMLALPPASRRDPLLISADEARAIEEETAERRRENRRIEQGKFLDRKARREGKVRISFAEAALQWSLAGMPGDRPPEVTMHAERSRSAAAQRTRRELGDAPEAVEAANGAGRRAYRAVLASWGKYAAKNGYPLPPNDRLRKKRPPPPLAKSA